jgi:hypothetical protein
MSARVFAFAFAALVTSGVAVAQEVDVSGSLSGELRVFPEDPRFADQDDRHFEPSLAFEPEFRAEWDDGTRVTVIPFLRYDPADLKGRTHVDLREANIYVEGDDWDVTAGLGKVFWGVAESRHLVDVINQTDLVEDIDGEDKLGQPMVNLTLLRDWGTVGLFVLPGFRERTFPDTESRLRGSAPIDTAQTQYESAAENKRVDFATRYSHFFGNWDIGVSHFHGTSRDPRFVEVTRNDGSAAFAPVYDVIHQTGLDAQFTTDAWLWKLEAIRHSGFRSGGGAFLAAVGGFEYTLFGVADSAADLGLLAEYLWDDRKAGAPVTLFDRDVFTGARLALNDAQSTEALVGLVTDTGTREMLMLAEAERRIGDTMKAEIELRYFLNVDATSPTAGLRDDGQATFRLNWYF